MSWIDPYDDTLAQRIADGYVTFEIVNEGPDEPAPYYTRLWTQIFTSGDTSPRHWAWLASAMHNADHVLADLQTTDRSDRTLFRGGEQWCKAACNAYHTLKSADAYAFLAPASAHRCLGDEDTIRTWLAAPAPGWGRDEATVADELDLDWRLDGSGHVPVASLDELLTEAQAVGVFGVPEHRIEPHLIHPDGLALVTRPIHGYLVDLTPDRRATPRTNLDLGPAIALAPVRLADLVASRAAGVDAAVAMLANAAVIVNASLHPADTNPRGTAPPGRGGGEPSAPSTPSTRRAQAFPPPTGQPVPSPHPGGDQPTGRYPETPGRQR